MIILIYIYNIKRKLIAFSFTFINQRENKNRKARRSKIQLIVRLTQEISCILCVSSVDYLTEQKP